MEAITAALGIRPLNGAVTGASDFTDSLHDVVQDLCKFAAYTRQQSTPEATREGMPVSFEC